MSCVIDSRSNLNDVVGERLAKSLDSVAGRYPEEGMEDFLAILYDDKFQQFVLDNVNQFNIVGGDFEDFIKSFRSFDVKTYEKINANKFRSLLREYHDRYYNASVDNTRVKKSMGGLAGFSSGAAMNTAKVYTANLIVDQYRNELSKNPKERKSPERIIESVNRQILGVFYNRLEEFANMAYEHAETEDAARKAKEYLDKAKELEDVRQKGNEAVEAKRNVLHEINARVANDKNLKKASDRAAKSKNADTFNKIEEIRNENRKIFEQLNEELKKHNETIKEFAKQVAALERDKYVMGMNLVSENADLADRKYMTKLRNYANLVRLTRIDASLGEDAMRDTSAWYFRVFTTKTMTSVIKEFAKLGDIEEFLEEEDANNDEVINKNNTSGVDETTKSWEDSSYKNFNQAINGKLRVVLSTVPKMSAKFDSALESQQIDTENELGVPEYMDAQFLTVQMFDRVDTSSVDAMIRSLKEKSQRIKALYGLGKIVDMMERDRCFANYIFANFAKPVHKKTMLTVADIANDDEITFDYSNTAAFAVTELVFRMANKLRATYDSSYDRRDDEVLGKIDRMVKARFGNRAEITGMLFAVVNKYFPNFTRASFDNYFDNVQDNFNEHVDQIIRHMTSVINEVRKLKNAKNSAIQEASRKYKEAREKYSRDMTAYIALSPVERKNVKRPERPVLELIDDSKYDLSATCYREIIGLAEELSKYSESHIRLNSANAEGNTSSDVMKNCYITRLFDLIDTERDGNENAGLEAFKNYVTQGTENGEENQYSHNPLLFGVRDLNGNQVAKGMFARTSIGYAVEDNAKSVMRLSLFDGSKNTQDGSSAGYDGMTKLDFFITQYMAFTKSVADITDGQKTTSIGSLRSAVYSMRIGSDAPKIYFIRAPRYDKETAKLAIYGHVMDELNIMINGLNAVFQNEGGKYMTPETNRGLYDHAFYNKKTGAVVENGRLAGNVFKFLRLFSVNGYDAGKDLDSILSLYGETGVISDGGNGRLMIHPDSLTADKTVVMGENGKFKLNLTAEQRQAIKDVVDKWTEAFLDECASRTSEFVKVLEDNNIKYDRETLEDFLLNTTCMNMSYDDLFEGDFKFYKNARDFLKRTKETQAGGDGYAGYDTLDTMTNQVVDNQRDGSVDKITYPEGEVITIGGRELTFRNGWRGVTIYNTIKASDVAEEMQEELEKKFKAQGMKDDVAHDRAVKIAAGYGYNSATVKGAVTTVNDAQSYITIDEFIRRKYADGTLGEYAELIRQLLDDTPVEQIDLEKVNKMIQVQKNFYFDKVWDGDVGMFVPRQIKNAEFVLIPKLLPDELKKVYDWMHENDIGQLNTEEASKAAKKGVFAIWDENTGEFDENFAEKFDESVHMEQYSYKYLYKQQEVPQHMMDEENKAGSQVTKIIQNNIINENEEGNEERKVLLQKVREYQDAITANIEDDFFNFLDAMGWEYDAKKGKIVNAEYARTNKEGGRLSPKQIKENRERLDFTNFLARAREEAARLGMDSNFIDYLVPNEFGVPLMPNWTNVAASKLESVAQALYNRSVTRQTLPGWHAVQVTGVGYSRKLRFDPKTGVMEVLLPRWSKLIPKGKTKEEDEAILKQLQTEGIDIHLGYRIPTEGKQSVSVLRVVGFTPECLGSTIIVSDDWVTQTGSDMDVDSIYGICYELFKTVDKKGNVSLHRIPCEESETNDNDLYVQYVNGQLETRVRRKSLKDDIDTAVEETKERLGNVAAKAEFNKEYNKLDNDRNVLYGKLPAAARNIIRSVNSRNITKTKDNAAVVDIEKAYPEINKALDEYLSMNEVPESDKRNVEQYIELQCGLLDIINAQHGLPVADRETYRTEIAEAIRQAIDKARADYFAEVERTAKENGLLSFEQFKKLPYVKRLGRRARNNYIVSRMIDIINDDISREEQYGRSQFESITNDDGTGANDIIDRLSGETSRSRSPYNPLDQLDYYDDVMGGRRLKAQSVNWDRIASVNNVVRANISGSDVVHVILTVDGKSAEDSEITYDEEEIRKSYGDAVTEYVQNEPENSNDSSSTGNAPIQGADVSKFVLHTGSQADGKLTEGGDAIWNEIAMEYGIKRENVKAYSPDDLKALPAEEKWKVENAYKASVAGIGRREKPANWTVNGVPYGMLLRRSYLQVNNTGGVFAIAPLESDMRKVSGGTAYAVQMAIDLDKGIPIYVLDLNTKQWHVYDYGRKRFVISDRPVLTHDFTGIGSRKADGLDWVKDEVRKVFQKTINGVPGNASSTGGRKEDRTCKLYKNITMKASRIEELMPLIERVNEDSKLIKIPWKDFVKYNGKVLTESGNIYKISDEIREFLANWYSYEEIPFERGQVYITKSLYELLQKTTPEEFVGILNGIDTIIDQGEVPVKERVITNDLIYSFLKDENNDDKMVSAINQAFESEDYYNKTEFTRQGKFRFVTSIAEEVVNNMLLQEKYPKSYNLLLSIYNKQHGIETQKPKQNGKRKLLFTADKFGWSRNNRNLVGDYVTTYGSQTTAHHLDAVKRGSVPNVNEYTFSVYKYIVELGIDFENNIGFIRQPIITRLVNNNNLINSVFVSSNTDPVQMTLANIANDLGLKDGSRDITGDTYIRTIIDALKGNASLVDAFSRIFGVNLAGLNYREFMSMKLPLDKEAMFDRIKRERDKTGNPYENAAFDLGMLMTFKNIKKSADKINSIIMASNADGYGAMPSIHQTRQMVEQVDKLRKDGTLSKGGVSFMDLLYPLKENGEVDVEHSAYKQIAAIYAYSTMTSYKTNSQFFVTENDDFASAENEIKRKIGHKFTEEEYKEYKRYAIATLYNQVQRLLSPVKVNRKGQIMLDAYSEYYRPGYWNEERSRIYGYGVATDGDFEIGDVNNPTDEELEKYEKLTPAQKVLFIQRHFPDNQGVFGFIKVTLINNTEAKYKGVSRQYMSYDDQLYNSDDLFQEFRNAFANHNPLVKLAAIDLIKYAFIAEGHNYKSGYISKIIPNDVLYTSRYAGGFDIISSSDSKNSLTTMIHELPETIKSDEFVERYVRSHPDVIKITRMPRLPEKRVNFDGTESFSYHNNSTIFRHYMREDGLVHIDATVNDPRVSRLCKKLNLNKSANGKFLRINFPVNENKNVTVLYKVMAMNSTETGKSAFEDYFLIPLNLLDRYEVYDYSYNANYNNFNSREYYDSLARDLAFEAASYRRDTDQGLEYYQTMMAASENDEERARFSEFIEELKRDRAKARMEAASQVTQYVKDVGRHPVGGYTGQKISLKDDAGGLMELYHGGDERTKGAVKRLVDGVIEHINSDAEFTGRYYQLNTSPQLRHLIPRGETVRQTIYDEKNDMFYDVLIKHLNQFKDKTGEIKTNLADVLDKVMTGKEDHPELDKVVADMRNADIVPERADVYVVKKAPITKQEASERAMNAATSLIGDEEETENETSSMPSPRREIDDVSVLMINEISYKAKRNSSQIAKQFVKEIESRHINRQMRSSLAEHREDVYVSAARYYQSAANNILNALNGFKMVDRDGVPHVYRMDDPEMYRALAENDEFFGEVAGIILDGITFGNRIAQIFKLDLSIEDKETKDAVEKIIKSINSVRQNKMLSDAMENLMNIYFKKFSTNPGIISDVIKLRETFGDLDVIDTWITNPADIENSEVQVILKQVYAMFNKAEMFDVSRNVKEWKDRLAEIEAMEGSLDINNVINFDNMTIRQDFDQKFLKDKQEVVNRLNEARSAFEKAKTVKDWEECYDEYKNYLIAKYERDKFMYEHVKQFAKDEYFKEDLEMRKEAMDKAGENYFLYMLINYKKNSITTEDDVNDEGSANLKRRLISWMNNLSSELEMDNMLKEEEAAAKSRALAKYLKKRKEWWAKYYDTKEYSGFTETYARYKKYIDRYNGDHKGQTLAEKLLDSDYKEAYDWIKNNGRVRFNEEQREKLQNAFKTLTGRKSAIPSSTMAKLRKIEGVVDENGNIDPRKLTPEQIAQLKREEENEYTKMYNDGLGEFNLIKVKFGESIPLRQKSRKSYEVNPDKGPVIQQINAILGKVLDRKTGKIEFALLFNDEVVTFEERKKLAALYKKLKEIGEKENALFGSVNKDFVYNRNEFNEALNYARTHLIGTKDMKLFNDIFLDFKDDGSYSPNFYLFGHRYPDPEVQDVEATEALRFIRENVEFVPTEAYYEAMEEASRNGTYEEWFMNNHIYDTYEHRYKPLKVWTKLEAKPDSPLSKSVEYVPTFDNMEHNVKEEWVNGEYKEFDWNYKKGSGYDSPIKRNAKEEALRQLITQTMHKYATTYQGRRFVGQGYLPRERKDEINPRWMLNQAASLFGWSWHSGRESDSFREQVDFTHDKEADMNMLSILKVKGTKEYKPIPQRGTMPQDEYDEAVAKVREENRKIKEENEKLEKGSLNRDWKQVMEDYVHNATIFNSRQAAKPYLYLLLEDLVNNNAYMLKGMWNRHPVKDRMASTTDDTRYRTMPLKNTSEIIHNLARRLLFGEYQEKSKLRSFSNLLQNLASAKYMVFNLYGGIANIATGKVNIAGEQFAGEYFGFGDFAAAERQWLAHSAEYVATLYSDKAKSLTGAFIKKFKVIDFDEVLQYGQGSADLHEQIKRVRNFMYSFQSMGEHYMQNSVLLAMLKSNRLYTDKNGTRRVGDFKDFCWDIEQKAMETVLRDDPNLLMNYKAYIESVKYDIDEKTAIATGRKNYNRSFLYSLKSGNTPEAEALFKGTVDAYVKERDRLMKEAKESFASNPTIESLFEFSNGEAVLKKQVVEEFNGKGKNPIGDIEHLMGEFRQKVIEVNHKIHGVYDKNSAAMVEKKWFGSLLMQYKKHVYTGVMKRWRRRGYYSEFRGGMERGSYQALIDFLSIEFSNFTNRRQAKQENGANVVFASLQVAMESLINTFSASNFTTNKELLSPWEKRNIKRCLGDMSGVLVACAIVLALYGLYDDDEIKDDTFKSSLLYLADRLYSETTMYTPAGLVSEVQTSWRSPIAGAGGPKDAFKLMVLIPQALFDPNYNPEYETGVYAGENKIDLLIKRNMPAIRPLERIKLITSNNKYYKVGESQIGISIARTFGEALHGE